MNFVDRDIGDQAADASKVKSLSDRRRDERGRLLPTTPGERRDKRKHRSVWRRLTDLSGLVGLTDLDGRGAAAKRVVELYSQYISDQGGEQDCSVGQRSLAMQAAVTQAMAEDFAGRWALGQEINVDTYNTTVNLHRRLVMTLGLRRVPRDVGPTLGDLLRYDRQQQREAP